MGKLIKLQDLTPSVYYAQSRDFQFIGRLYDVVLNSVKLNSELLYNIPLSDDVDSNLLDLLTLTLGFKSKHDYNIKQLTALCTAFSNILKNKGSIYAVENACNTLLHAEGIYKNADFEIKDNNMVIYIPNELSDINLLKDLLNYVLPAGMTCKIVRELKIDELSITDISYNTSIVKYEKNVHDVDLSIIPKVDDERISEIRAKNNPGLIVNSSVLR